MSNNKKKLAPRFNQLNLIQRPSTAQNPSLKIPKKKMLPKLKPQSNKKA